MREFGRQADPGSYARPTNLRADVSYCRNDSSNCFVGRHL